MGVVYTATQLSLNRTVALKFLADILGDDPDFRERFRREGLIQAALDHPHIVPVYEAGEVDDGLFLAMRLGARGEPEGADRLRPARRRRARCACSARSPTRSTPRTRPGLIHRDIKPQNILVGARDHAYLADFGLTKEAGATGVTRRASSSAPSTTSRPELISGHVGDPRSDLYALAAVLFECLTGQVPFVRASDAALLYAHVADPVPSVTALRDDLPAAIDAVIATAMAKDPDARHESATAMIERRGGGARRRRRRGPGAVRRSDAVRAPPRPDHRPRHHPRVPPRDTRGRARDPRLGAARAGHPGRRPRARRGRRDAAAASNRAAGDPRLRARGRPRDSRLRPPSRPRSARISEPLQYTAYTRGLSPVYERYDRGGDRPAGVALVAAAAGRF